jgi:acyl carrier protein
VSSTVDAVRKALIRDLCARNPDLSSERVRPDAELLGAGYLDSLSATEFLSHIEETYGVQIGLDRLVGDLATMDALARHLAAAGKVRC